MLDREELLRRIREAEARHWAFLVAERKAKALRLVADTETALGELAELCQDPEVRKVVARDFRALEVALAVLAVAAGVVAPEPEEVGK